MSKKKKFKLAVVVKYLVLVILLLVFLYKITGLLVHSKKEVVVPNIVNKSVVEALEMVSKVGLALRKVGEVYNPEYPVGTIVSQQPSAGMTVREGRFVNVILSLGGEKVFVPDIIGEDKRKAEVVLRQYNLFVGTVTERYSLRYSKNKIIEQNPPPGEVVDKNSYINITISLGIPPESEDIILMPDFVNKSVNEVYLWAQKYAINVLTEQKLVTGVPEGTVVEQTPVPDTIIEPTTVVKVYVSKNTSGEYVPQYNFEYEIPFISDTGKNVKVVQISSEGEYVLYDRITMPKQKIQLYVPPRKNSRIRIFLDGVLIDEK